jgi:uncharacterized protein YtpQ (UPF0354 family)
MSVQDTIETAEITMDINQILEELDKLTPEEIEQVAQFVENELLKLSEK